MRTKDLFGVLALIIILLPLLLLVFLPVPVKAATSININPVSGAIGVSVLINGDGFAGRLATIYWDEKGIAQKVPISEAGKLTYSFNVPVACKGGHVIKITDDSNWASSSALITFDVLPQIKIFPPIGLVWGNIIVSGDGFAANENDIRITWDVSVLPGRLGFTADWLGRWNATFDVPQPATKGNHFVGAFGSKTTVDEVAKASFILAPVAKGEPVSGPPGTEIMISGIGFRIGEDGITITYDGEIIKCNIVAEYDGSWKTDLSIPASTKGRHKIGIYGSSFTPVGVVPGIDFEVIPQINLQPALGNKGTKVTVTGTGFAKGEAVTINFDAIKVISAIADNSGSFDAILVVPQIKGKEHVVAATGSSGSSAQANFVMEKLQPSAPQLLSPVQGARLEIFGSFGDVIFGTARYLVGVFDYLRGSKQKSLRPALTTFTWTKPAEPSKVSYVFQIARTHDFSSPVLVKEGLVSSSYTLSRDDVLIPGDYNWRVKAVDDIGNESEWSEVWKIGVISISNRILIISLVSLVLVIVALVFGMLTWRVNRSNL